MSHDEPGMPTGVEIRPLSTIAEYRACVAMQEATWGEGFSERVPTAILKVAQILGGVASGAWSAEGRLEGFVFGMTGLYEGQIVHWSDMLAVRPEMRGRGIGRALKLHQRAVLLDRGITTMLWTFDPLRARNAHLNFAKLGIVAREYRRDMYGQTDSPLHRGIGTDRLIALWHMKSPRVVARIAGKATDDDPATRGAVPAVVDRDPDPEMAQPAPPDLSRTERWLRIVVPPDVAQLLDHDLPLARRWRSVTREAFESYLSRGWEVREFVRDPLAPAYLLERSEEST